MIRATVESLAYQAHDVIRAMEMDAGRKLSALRVDGGASANDFLMQFQADILDAKVVRPKCIETTALGAACLAGLATGFWKDAEEIRENWQQDKVFVPEISKEKRDALLKGWRRAVRCTLEWTREEE